MPRVNRRRTPTSQFQTVSEFRILVRRSISETDASVVSLKIKLVAASCLLAGVPDFAIVFIATKHLCEPRDSKPS